MASRGVTVREVREATSVDDPDLRASVDVYNATLEDLMGHGELSMSYAETARLWRPTPYGHERRFVAEVDGAVVGRAYAGMPLTEDPDKAFVNLLVHPRERRRGVGSALLRTIARVTHDAGRTRYHAWTVSTRGTDTADASFVARTGAGGVPSDDSGARFALANGFVLRQVERMSRLDVPTARDRIRPMLSLAAEQAGSAYRTLGWRGETPRERLDDLAWLWSRMSTDAPHGDIDVEEQVWDADRVIAAEQRMGSEDRFLLTVAAEHVDSGRLVVFTNMTVPRDSSRAARQEITLVTREHRGHRLGTLVKAANLVQLAELAPETPAVYTWNAEENEPMLTVNDVLGFEAVGVEGQWERTTPLVLD